MAPSPKLSDQESARLPRLDRGREGAPTCHPQRAWHPLSSPRATCPKRAGSWTGGFEGGERDSDRGGAPPSPDSTGRSWAPSWQSARGTHRQPLSLGSGALGGAGWAGGGERRPRPSPRNPRLPRGPPPARSRATLARPLPAPQPSVYRERTRPRSPGRAEAGTARWGAAHGHDGRGGRLLLSWHWAQNTQRVPCSVSYFQHDHTLSGFPPACHPCTACSVRPPLAGRPGAVAEIVGRRAARESHTLPGGPFRVQRGRGLGTSPSISFSSQLNPDCACGRFHVTGLAQE